MLGLCESRFGPSRGRRANETGSGSDLRSAERAEAGSASGRKLSTRTRSTSRLSQQDQITMASTSTVWINGWSRLSTLQRGQWRVDEGSAEFRQPLDRVGRVEQRLRGVDARPDSPAAQPEQPFDAQGDAERGQRALPVRVDE